MELPLFVHSLRRRLGLGLGRGLGGPLRRVGRRLDPLRLVGGSPRRLVEELLRRVLSSSGLGLGDGRGLGVGFALPSILMSMQFRNHSPNAVAQYH